MLGKETASRLAGIFETLNLQYVNIWQDTHTQIQIFRATIKTI